MFEAVVIAAMEICIGSAQYPQCVAWMQKCIVMTTEDVTERSFSNATERCAESLPDWALEGM